MNVLGIIADICTIGSFVVAIIALMKVSSIENKINITGDHNKTQSFNHTGNVGNDSTVNNVGRDQHYHQ